ncbi:DMT family transporter [Cellvibrio japonicus]|uniref:Permeases of the drug/metabolite transporter (DMT) superfamily n=1 Tax=Cellvibrio japonicus (strain Ueda107) TaxID=498211 RepID=B3PI56_CELJU|nr:DMT family transporter [Cellvibrio japonicus]ACE85586.1 Permeases of the drug/metabolite transporter (DMT) superfamily [Cellvibrio japonicus Ueda107]QEI11104.1 DMT family transporter [Cellvibrio japonicus]QEI14678.1 DMT family transporter [Cellvibrio japonicus]QEI18258.1 DMT family transporter [Cellvibrio japonicus]
MSHTSSRLSPEGILLLLGIGFGWGLNWPIMKYIISEIPPLSFRGFCLLLGGLGILALARIGGHSLRIPRAYWGKIFWVCLFNILAWNIMATFGLSLLPAGRSALLGYTMPLWTVLLSVLILKDSFSVRIGLALVLGLGGIFALLSDSLLSWFGGPLNSSLLLGAGLMVGAAWGWALGTVLLKRWKIPLHSVVLTGWLLLLASLPTLVAAAWFDGIPHSMPDQWALWGVVYNVFIGFMFCYWAWVRLVELVPVSVSSLSSLITPLIGVASSIILLGEEPGWPEISATLLILGAVAVVNWKPGNAKQKY